ncbi:MAG: tRNA (adenosine(37)-N6)-threonylcarbamoyltransferase complex transferase subunit TsaD, partial [Bacteroidota bacterium]
MNKELGNIVTLGIESSCDDTSCAILRGTKLLANIIANQEIHREYGGVVPELASRSHLKNIIPLLDFTLKKAKVNLSEIDLVAYTRGPGLTGSLLVGSSVAKSLSIALQKPLVEVNHMHAHILAHFIQRENSINKIPDFPFLCLTVSGGHTQLVRVDGFQSFVLLGETIDDAVGEAFDKGAKILNLPYPGGPLIDQYSKKGNPRTFKFSKPNVAELNFSFSGLKTSLLYFIKSQSEKDSNFIENNLFDICASYQHTITEILIEKLVQAIEQTNIKQIAIAGGVSANSELRKKILEIKGQYG